MASRKGDLLLTGATGFLGHYLLADLTRRSPARCHVLVRPPLAVGLKRLGELLVHLGLDLDRLIRAGRVRPFEGELPGLLDVDGLEAVDTIVHAAASTCFEADAGGEPTRTNFDGTRSMLDAAERIGARRFMYVSTAYVCGNRTGHVPEAMSPASPPACNAYEQSKWQAEQLVWQWQSDTRTVSIFRPSILFGDRRNGRATSMTGVYLIARATELLSRAVADDPTADRHRIPLRILGRAEATSNLVPADWVADRMVPRILDESFDGGVYHVTNPDPPTHAEIKQWLEEVYDVAGGAFCDSTGPLRDPNHYEELFYSLGNVVRDYFRHGLTFASSCADDTPPGVRLVDRQLFVRSLDYCQKTNWGRNMRQPVRATPPPGALEPGWYFEQFLPEAVPQSSVALVEGLTTTVRFIITDEHEGQWVCRFNKGLLADVHAGSNGISEEFGYRVAYGGFIGIITGRQTLQEVFFRGHADMFGNIDHALKMVSIMAEFLREYPVVQT